MTKRLISVILCLLCFLMCACALADEALPANALDIAGSFDASDWSIGDTKWLSPLDDYIQAMEFGDEVLLTSLESDVQLTRTLYVQDFERECTVTYMYEFMSDGPQLCQIKIAAPVASDEDLKALVEDARAIHASLSQKYDESLAGTDVLDSMDYGQDDIDALANPKEGFVRHFWNSKVQIAELNGRALGGLLSIGYEEVKGEPTIFVTLGATSLK